MGSTSSEEFDVVRKTKNYRQVHYNNSKLSLNKPLALHKTSSGVSSISEQNSDIIETNKAVENGSLQLPLQKKDPEKKLFAVHKKIKLNNGNSQDLLDNSLNFLNITRNLAENEQVSKAKHHEYDAFADYLSSQKAEKKDTKVDSLQDNQDEVKDVLTSQWFNTQVINEVEEIITEKKSNINEQKEDVNCKNDDFKLPLIHSFKEKIKYRDSNKETNLDKEIGERSILFEDEKVTSQYRQEVDHLFDEIEQSIFTMGMENVEKRVPDKLLDIIFNDDISSEPNNESETPSDLSGNKLSLSNFNMSFGTVIKTALLNNATKSVQPRKILDSTLNATLSERKVEFECLGPFYGLPLKVKHLIKQYKGIEELYDWQDECLKLPAIEQKKNLIYALPTSGGKTLVAEILIFRELLCYKRNAILVLPYVSIVQEKVWALSPFGVALDFLVEEYASSKGGYPPRKRRRKNSIYVATIEKALGIVNSLIEMGRINEIGLIVIDELHLIGAEGRGCALEASLSKLMFLKTNLQIIGMSATIGNLPEICKFLNAEVYTKNFRPVELVEYVKCGKEIAKINWNYTEEQDLLIEPKRVNYKYSESILKLDPDMLGGLVMDIIPKDSVLIFCASKKNCENVTHLLCKLCKPDLKNHYKTEKEQLIHALKDEGGEICDILKVSMQYGIAYHHSGLTSDERRIIEEGFRAGIISVICCTSTLAAGVNLPARRVILRSPYIGRDFINLSRYKQMVGRAGRAGLGETGDSILITQPRDLPRVKELLACPMDQAISSMHLVEGKGLRQLLLSCISLGVANTRKQLQEVASYTLLTVQAQKLEVDIKKLTDKIIRNLFKLGALKESCGKRKQETENPLADVSVRLETSVLESAENVNAPSTSKEKRTIVLTNQTKLVVSELGCASIKGHDGHTSERCRQSNAENTSTSFPPLKMPAVEADITLGVNLHGQWPINPENGGLELTKAHLLYEDLYLAQSSLVLKGHLHLLYLVTPYETAEQIKPNMQVYYDIITRLDPDDLKVARMLGINESVAVKMLSNNPIKNVPERTLNRFYVTLMLYDLWNEMPVFQVSQKYQMSRGVVQNLMTISATFASNVVNFCEELPEFWAFSHLLKGMSQRLSHCCMKELQSLMELPAVKQSRARQLYNAGYKTLQSIAKANVNDLVETIEFMPRRVASQLIAASKMLLLERVENLREDAEDVLDGVENPKRLSQF